MRNWTRITCGRDGCSNPPSSVIWIGLLGDYTEVGVATCSQHMDEARTEPISVFTDHEQNDLVYAGSGCHRSGVVL